MLNNRHEYGTAKKYTAINKAMKKKQQNESLEKYVYSNLPPIQQIEEQQVNEPNRAATPYVQYTRPTTKRYT